MAEAARALRDGGILVLLDVFPFERFDLLLAGQQLKLIDRAEHAVNVRWGREAAERAITLYAQGWVAQAQIDDDPARMQARHKAYCEMLENMECQLAERGYYVPSGPLRMVVVRMEANQ